jgi:DeoR family fructose operon transcriptional repressor
MLAEERSQRILSALQHKSAISVTELAELLQTSESTIRRDINTMAEAGKLKKIYGGAAAVTAEPIYTDEPDMPTKSQLNVEEKTQIAQYAAQTIHDGDFVFLDAGTTTLLLADFIENTKAVYVTNGIMHAKKLTQKGCTVYVTGGQLKLATEAIIGTESVHSIQKYNFNKAFLGANGIDPECGYTTPDINEMLIKSEVVRRSYVSFILADHTKFGKVSAVTFANLNQACIITGRLPDPKYAELTPVKEVLT